MWHFLISGFLFISYGYAAYKIGFEGGKSTGWIAGFDTCKRIYDEPYDE